jgi:hypothetical protein
MPTTCWPQWVWQLDWVLGPDYSGPGLSSAVINDLWCSYPHMHLSSFIHYAPDLFPYFTNVAPTGIWSKPKTAQKERQEHKGLIQLFFLILSLCFFSHYPPWLISSFRKYFAEYTPQPYQFIFLCRGTSVLCAIKTWQRVGLVHSEFSPSRFVAPPNDSLEIQKAEMEICGGESPSRDPIAGPNQYHLSLFYDFIGLES